MISVSSLTAGYDDFTIRDITLDVPRGIFCALAGSNGSGKTTFLKALGGGLKPSSGKVKISGRNICSLSAAARARLACYVPPEFNTAFPFTVREIVMMGRNPHLGRFDRPSAADLDAAEDAMETAGCLSLADRSINELSSGQRQTALIARAVCQHSPVMLLDEPSSHLDAAQAAAILETLCGLAASGRTIIAAMHDLGAASAFCQRVLMMKDGLLKADGRPGDVLCAGTLEDIFGCGFEVTSVKGRIFAAPRRI